MRRTIYIPDELAARVDEYLTLHQGETLSSLVRRVLEGEMPPKSRRSILELAGFVDVDTFECEEKARKFADHPEDQYYDWYDGPPREFTPCHSGGEQEQERSC